MSEPSAAAARLDEIARIYDAAGDFDGVLTGFAWELLRGRLHDGARVLELGCSSGVMTALLAAHPGVAALTVVDGSRAYLDDVAARLAPRPGLEVRFEHALFEDYRPAERHDDVIMARAVEHLAAPRPVLAAARGWLTERGQLHVMVPNALSFHRLLGVAMGLLPEPHALNERDRAYGHHRVYDADSLAAELEGAGWEVVEAGGSFLKFLSNAQMQALPPPVWDGLHRLGASFPRHCAELYARCRPRR
jgi:SAM-dependent methyltransferase